MVVEAKELVCDEIWLIIALDMAIMADTETRASKIDPKYPPERPLYVVHLSTKTRP